jgi:hypothetical protein
VAGRAQACTAFARTHTKAHTRTRTRTRRLNYINDFDPESHKFKRPIYAIDASTSKTGTLDCYKPKGTWDNPAKRNWLKYEVSVGWGPLSVVVWFVTEMHWLRAVQ